MEQQVEIKKTSCAFCGLACGMLVHVKDGKIIKVEGNPDHDVSWGHRCEKNTRWEKWLNHPGQLMYPLKRAGERGEGKWQRVTWDEALGEIGEKLNELKGRYGPETLGTIEGSWIGQDRWPRGRFLNLFGSRNFFCPGAICFYNLMAMDLAVSGDVIALGANMLFSKCIVWWGTDASQSLPPWWRDGLEAKKRGAKFIVIDPRRTEAVKKADMWLQLRPGTDAALNLGWLNVIINEGLYDKEFVDKWTVGFDKLVERVQEYPVERVAQITGLKPEEIIQSARMYATNKPACIGYGAACDEIGLTATTHEHAKLCLRAITGNIDVLGGELIRRPGEKINQGAFVSSSELCLLDKLSPEQRRRQLGYDVHKLMTMNGYETFRKPFEEVCGVPLWSTQGFGSHVSMLWPAITEGKPYPIKALITFESNPLLWSGPTNKVYEALKSSNLELHIIQELFMTPTAALADYVFPAASWMERSYCSDHSEVFGSICEAGERPIPPMGERKTAYEFWRGLALAVGQPREYWPWETDDEVNEYRVKPMGFTFQEVVDKSVVVSESFFNFREKDGLMVRHMYEEKGFPTPSRKVELYRNTLEKLGYDPLPWYKEPAESPVSTPEVAREYPLILNTGGRVKTFYQSMSREWGTGARESHPDPLMDIHPETARDLGINDGDWAYIETRRGRIKQRARLNDGILPNVINAEMGWWFPENPAEEPSLYGVWESNANVLVLDDIDACDPLCGGTQLRALLCKVYKA